MFILIPEFIFVIFLLQLELRMNFSIPTKQLLVSGTLENKLNIVRFQVVLINESLINHRAFSTSDKDQYGGNPESLGKIWST